MTNITINGKIMAVLTKNYQEQTTHYVQFLMETEAKGMEIIKVKLTKDDDMAKIEKGAFVSIPVNISSVNGNIYYSQADTLKINK
jgi:hypothetical protein